MNEIYKILIRLIVDVCDSPIKEEEVIKELETNQTGLSEWMRL